MSDEELVVLFVDDQQSLLDVLEDAIPERHPGWKVLCASSPVAGIKAYRKFRKQIDVVVCDIKMPEISGIDIMYAVRSQSPATGIISLSGQIDRDALVGVRKYADAHLCKPFTIDALCAEIIRVSAAKRSERGRRAPA